MTDISIKQIQEVGEYWIVYKSTEGKTRIQFSLKSGLLGGKKAAQKLRQQYEAFEAKRNSFGWNTIEESN